MKKGLILVILTALVVVLAADVQQAIERKEAPYVQDAPVQRPATREAPEWSFITTPQDIVTTYYDYMPGSYISYPLRVQTNNAPGANGAYIGFHATETANATRRAYYAYINTDGTVNSTAYLSQNDLHEGYVGTAIDPVTQDPFFAWHVNADEDEANEVVMSYDMWHMLSSPGLVSTPITVLDQQEYAGVYTPESDDEFIWPYTYIVKAPTFDTDGKRRIYIVANNYTTHQEDPSENVLIKWADFTTANIEAGNFATLDWHYITFPLLDDYNNGANWGRYNKGVAFNDEGQCGLIGYLSADDVPNGSDLVVFYNDNWAEGDWDVVQVDANFFTVAPSHLDGSTIFEGVEPGDDTIFWSFTNSSHPNARFDNDGRLHLVGNMVLGQLDENDDLGLWAPFSSVKGVIYDPTEGEVIWQDLYPQSENPDYPFPCCFWDLDGDGEWSYDENELLVRYNCWPIWYYLWDDAFHENTFKFSASQSGKWMVAVWHDGLYSRYYNEDGYEDYAEWENISEIAISASADNGTTWSEPIFMNANPNAEVGYVQEFDGMMPTYIYPGDIIENIGDGHGKVHLFFLDDNSFGSYIQDNGANDGGTLTYAAIDINFGALPNALDADDNDITPYTSNLSNYPNPFNPTTNVCFSLAEPSNVELKIYNVRGDLVKTLYHDNMTAGEHTLTWTGENNNGSTVASGVYFAKLNAGGKVETRKMLLLK